MKLSAIDVSHGTTHDGPGMRTTVFVKGCSLHCLWCQNPESISKRNEPWWDKTHCIGCASCKDACKNGALSMDGDGVHIDRKKCLACLKCTEACPSEALTPEAQSYDLESLLRELLKDEHFYKENSGGVTFSGGEPLLQYEFIVEVFKSLQSRGITTALDTCGAAPQRNLEAILPYTDYVLYDMKIFDSEQHLHYTGLPNEPILSNLLYVAQYIRTSSRTVRLWIRTPLIPDATATEDNIRKIGTFLSSHLSDVVERWELCAFNGICQTKYERLGLQWHYAHQSPMSAQQVNGLLAAAYSVFPKEKIMASGMIKTDSAK